MRLSHSPRSRTINREEIARLIFNVSNDYQIVGSVYLVGNVYLVVVKYSSAHLVRVRHPLAVCLFSLKPRGVGLSVSYRPREL